MHRQLGPFHPTIRIDLHHGAAPHPRHRSPRGPAIVTSEALDASAFIAANFPLEPVPGLPQIRLHVAGPASRLSRIAGDLPPYWAYPWSGGAALARYFLERPETVRGRRVLDLGAGGGIVSIAAALAGASGIIASEADATGRAALELNLKANDVKASIVGDLTGAPPPAVDIVAGGDIFYAPEVAERMLVFLENCLAARLEVLVADPGRKYLPRERLELVAEYLVPEVGAARGSLAVTALVYRYWSGRRPNS